jgi:hypothetical protein
MWCNLLLAVGVACAQPVQPEPPRDRAADVLIEQEKRAAEREDAEVAAALEKRRKLYEGADRCANCGTVNTLPFRKEP